MSEKRKLPKPVKAWAAWVPSEGLIFPHMSKQMAQRDAQYWIVGGYDAYEIRVEIRPVPKRRKDSPSRAKPRTSKSRRKSRGK